MKLYNNGGRIERANAYTNDAEVIAIVGKINEQTRENTFFANLFCVSPELIGLIVEMQMALSKAIEKNAFADCVMPSIGEKLFDRAQIYINHLCGKGDRP